MSNKGRKSEIIAARQPHDTFGRVFAAINAEAFQTSFTRWVEAVFHVTKGQVIAIDGKTCRRSYGKGSGQEAIQMVSAWVQHNGSVLGQRKVADKANGSFFVHKAVKVAARHQMGNTRRGTKSKIVNFTTTYPKRDYMD
jgi:hypothetical protein